MKGYVAGLDDPYSQYMTDEEYSAYQTDEAGQTIGIGVTVQQNETATSRWYLSATILRQRMPGYRRMM